MVYSIASNIISVIQIIQKFFEKNITAPNPLSSELSGKYVCIIYPFRVSMMERGSLILF